MEDQYLFELSWEVCNKVGGIYTVISSKADLMNKNYKNFFFIGPYIENNAKFEFKEEKPPEEFQNVFNKIKEEGITAHYGYWLIQGSPRTILLDFQGYIRFKDQIKKDLWDSFKVDSLNTSWDYEEQIIFATAAGRFLEVFYNKQRISIQCHEWQTGSALLYLKRKNIKIASVFTTHATATGRALSLSGYNLYENLDNLNADKEARRVNNFPRHSLEKASALNADVFTTVSEITAMEAEKMLGRKPDILTLNGLDMNKFPSFEEASVEHRKNRESIRKFFSYYFFPNYYFDVENTLTFFIVGRYEIRNKGIDILIKSLARLNDILKKEKSEKTIITFFWVPTQVGSAKYKLAKNKTNYDLLEHFIQENSKTLNRKIIENILKCLDNSCEVKEGQIDILKLLGEDFTEDIRKLKLSFVREGDPPIITHNIENEHEHPIIKSLLEFGLDNKEDDKVKVIFYPVYLTGVDGLLDLAYYDCISGSHLGLFPSYYEPWGYTPLETAALGVPALTTDLTGFGRFIQSKKKGKSGIYIIQRIGKSEEEVVTEFTSKLYEYTNLDIKKRVSEKMKAKALANLADWNEFVGFYFEAHKLALKKANI